jgi:hypothetical protein
MKTKEIVEIARGLAKPFRIGKGKDFRLKELDLWFGDFPTAEWPVSSSLTFTFFGNAISARRLQLADNDFPHMGRH